MNNIDQNDVNNINNNVNEINNANNANEAEADFFADDVNEELDLRLPEDAINDIEIANPREVNNNAVNNAQEEVVNEQQEINNEVVNEGQELNNEEVNNEAVVEEQDAQYQFDYQMMHDFFTGKQLTREQKERFDSVDWDAVNDKTDEAAVNYWEGINNRIKDEVGAENIKPVDQLDDEPENLQQENAVENENVEHQNELENENPERQNEAENENVVQENILAPENGGQDNEAAPEERQKNKRQQEYEIEMERLKKEREQLAKDRAQFEAEKAKYEKELEERKKAAAKENVNAKPEEKKEENKKEENKKEENKKEEPKKEEPKKEEKQWKNPDSKKGVYEETDDLEDLTNKQADEAAKLVIFADTTVLYKKSSPEYKRMQKAVERFDKFMKGIKGRTTLTAEEMEKYDKYSLDVYKSTETYLKKKYEEEPKLDKNGKEIEKSKYEQERIRSVEAINNSVSNMRKDMFEKQIKVKVDEMHARCEQQLINLENSRQKIATSGEKDTNKLDRLMENNISHTLYYQNRMAQLQKKGELSMKPDESFSSAMSRLDASVIPQQSELEGIKENDLTQNMITKGVEKAKEGKPLNNNDIKNMQKEGVKNLIGAARNRMERARNRENQRRRSNSISVNRNRRNAMENRQPAGMHH